MTKLVTEHTLGLEVKIALIHGDITEEKVDAIVNAANPQLNHGGGVAGAIARRGGDRIQMESTQWVMEHGPVQNGQAAITSGGKLPCKYVIHVVGPVWGEGEEDRKLDLAVRTALQSADVLGINSIALPAISTGIYGFPIDRGAEIILLAIERYFNTILNTTLKDVRVTLIDAESVAIFGEFFELAGKAPNRASHS